VIYPVHIYIYDGVWKRKFALPIDITHSGEDERGIQNISGIICKSCRGVHVERILKSISKKLGAKMWIGNHMDHDAEQVYQCRPQMGSFPSAVRHTFVQFFVQQVSNTAFRFSTRNSFRTNECTYHLVCELLLGAFARPLATSCPSVRIELGFDWEDIHENFVMEVGRTVFY
jgi:hypothetical protein